MAIARPLDAGAGPAEGAALRPVPFWTAAEALAHMAPVHAGTAYETLRRYTFRVAEELPIPATVPAGNSSRDDHGNFGFDFYPQLRGRASGTWKSGSAMSRCRWQVFGAVAKTDTNLAALIRGNLDAVGRIEDDGADGVHRRLSPGCKSAWNLHPVFGVIGIQWGPGDSGSTVASMTEMGAGFGMLTVETIAKIRRAYFAQEKPIKAVGRAEKITRM